MEQELNLIRVSEDDIPAIIQDKVRGDVTAILDGARIVKVETESEAANALELVRFVKTGAARVETDMKSLTTPLNKRLKAIRSFFAPAIRALEDVEQNIKQVLRDYYSEQERIRREAQRKLDDEMRKKREEALKLAQENQRKAEEAALAARAAAIQGDHGQAAELRNQAAALEAKAVEIANAPAPVAPPVFEVEKPKGFSTRKTYKAEIENKMACIRWAIKAEEWGILDIDTKALNKLAQAKGEFFKADGCRLIEKTS